METTDMQVCEMRKAENKIVRSIKWEMKSELRINQQQIENNKKKKLQQLANWDLDKIMLSGWRVML